jgi:hypothetical protein
MPRTGADGYSSAGTTQVNAKVPEPLKEEFRDTCDELGESMTDVLQGAMEEFVEAHRDERVSAEREGFYPSDPYERDLYEVWLEVSSDDLRIYQRQHASALARETGNFQRSELSDNMMPLRRAGFAALGPMPVDLAGEAASRWRYWNIKPPAADPEQWSRRER